MGKIYFFISLLVLYGDIVKRFIAANAALTIVYALAICILFAIILQSGEKKRKYAGLNPLLLSIFSSILIFTYIFQLLTSFEAPFFSGLIHLLYMVIPLSYIIVLQRNLPQVRLDKLAYPFLWLMIPINIVGFIQYAVNPDFLISTAYNSDPLMGIGGVIERNLLEGGTFKRFPSIFTSADRYSAMGLMQFYLTCTILTENGKNLRQNYKWVIFNLFSSFIALGVAGARSRILIVLLTLTIVLFVLVFHFLFSKRRNFHNRGISTMFVLSVSIGLSIVLVYLYGNNDAAILLFMQQSFSQGDIQERLWEAVFLSLLPTDVSLFGKGLGTIGVAGKPGEFGIQSTWAESGLIWGGFILTSFLGIIIVMTLYSIKAALKGQIAQLIICFIPLLIVITGLLTGLTFAFELSTGILLAFAIVAATRKVSV